MNSAWKKILIRLGSKFKWLFFSVKFLIKIRRTFVFNQKWLENFYVSMEQLTDIYYYFWLIKSALLQMGS